MANIEFSPALATAYVSRMIGVTSYDLFTSARAISSVPLFNNAPSASNGTGFMQFKIMKGVVPTDFSTLLLPSTRASDVLINFPTSGPTTSSVWTPINQSNNPAILQSGFAPATQSGIATWFWGATTSGDSSRILQQFFGTIGDVGSGADLEIPDTSLIVGIPYSISNIRFRFPTIWATPNVYNETFSVEPAIPAPGQTSGIFLYQATRVLVANGAGTTNVTIEILPGSPSGAGLDISLPMVGGALDVVSDELYLTGDYLFRATFAETGHVRNFTLPATLAEAINISVLHPDVNGTFNMVFGPGNTGNTNNNSIVTYTNITKPAGSTVTTSGSFVLGPLNGEPAGGKVFNGIAVDLPGTYKYQYVFPATSHTLQYTFTSGLSSTPDTILVGQPYTLNFTGGLANADGTVIYTLTSKPAADTDPSRPIGVPSAALDLDPVTGNRELPQAAPAIPLSPGRYEYTVNFSVTGSFTTFMVVT